MDMTKKESLEVYPLEEYPVWSVIVLCYKNQDKLYGMLDSVFIQDYPRIQLIISDDGSYDFDVEMVRDYVEKNRGNNIIDVIVRKNAENMKTVTHVITVLELAGNNIVLTAADDRFISDSSITAYNRAFIGNPDALWAVARCNVVTPDYQRSIYLTPTAEDIPYFEAGDAKRLFSRWSRRSMAVPCSMAFRRAAFDAVGGIDSSYAYSEDWPLVLKLLRSGHAPIFLHKITAAHSTGGVTNSNTTYGVDVRRAFYMDKLHLFEQEVEPYLDMLEPEDLHAYRLYRKEIFDRAWFLDTEWEGQSRVKKLKLAFSSFQHFCWVLEEQYRKRERLIQPARMLFISQLLLFISKYLFSPDLEGKLRPVYLAAAWIDFFAALMFVLFTLIWVLFGIVFKRKQEIRRKLVN